MITQCERCVMNVGCDQSGLCIFHLLGNPSEFILIIIINPPRLLPLLVSTDTDLQWSLPLFVACSRSYSRSNEINYKNDIKKVFSASVFST